MVVEQVDALVGWRALVVDEAIRRAILERLVVTPLGSLPRRQVIRDVARSAALEGVTIGDADGRVQREAASMTAEHLLRPGDGGLWHLTASGRRALAAPAAPAAPALLNPVRAASGPQAPGLGVSAGARHQRPVVSPSPEANQRWTHSPGTWMTRSERQAGYGGSTQGGIQPSATTPNIFLYTDPGAGQKSGYDFDGWSPDGSAFTYTGEGRTGGQEMTKGNKAILEHRAASKSLRVFAADGTLPGSGTKDHVYLGEFAVDERDPYRIERAPDQHGDMRDVFVFRLLPLGEVLRRQQDGQHTPLIATAGGRGTGSGVSLDIATSPVDTAPPRQPWSEEDDERLRREVAAWLTVRSHDGAIPIPVDELRSVLVDGRRVPLLSTSSTVVVAEGFDTALAIATPYVPNSRERLFEDSPGDDGMLRISYRAANPLHPENRALRRAVERRAQLVWLFGVGRGMFLPVFPVFALAEDLDRREFLIDARPGGGSAPTDSVVEEQTRRYLIAETRRRLHQPVFRATVLRAYSSRCAVCSLRHERLLDAAHIVPDSDPRGIASVRNGLAMCKIHHAAFDADILGIRPQAGLVGVVEIRPDLLKEIDGPMLQHGLQGHHGLPLRVIPADPGEHPHRELLEQRYKEFRGAV